MASNKPYHEMDDAELRQAKIDWTENVANAAGWPSAYFSAKQLETICRAGAARGLDGFENPYSIRVG